MNNRRPIVSLYINLRTNLNLSTAYREEVVRASSNTMGPSSRSPSRGTSVPHSEISFSYIGRARAHTAPVTGITFGFKDGIESLISISEDQ